MFDFVRKHMRLMQFLLFLLIFPSFVLFGLEGYNRFNEKGEPVASVDGRDIGQTEWDTAHKREIDRLREAMPTLDAKLLDSPEARYATLEGLVRDRVLAAAAAKGNLMASDQRLARALEENQDIARLRRPDGKLDMDRYRQLVGSKGMTPEMFENEVRADLSTRQVLASVGATGFPPAGPADVALDAYFQKREVQVARFSSQDYVIRVMPTDADLENYYKANPSLFQAPEQADIEYLVLDTDAVKSSIVVNEQDLKTYYEQNAARLGGQEERRASHILVDSPKSAPAADRERAKARASELLATVRKAPASFGDVAKKNSQDFDSAPNGGDLDWKARGGLVSKAMENAIFAMKKDEIGEVVESEFGYHVIKLNDIRAPKQRTFAELRPELEADVRKQQAQRKYAEVAESFTNLVYEQADSLKAAADRLKLQVRTAKQVMRKPAAGTTGPLANPKFLNALFGPDAVEKKRNTEALEVGPGQMVSGRITQYTPARTRPLAEVKDEVRQRLVASRAAELARKDGMEKLAAWKAAPATAGVGAPVVVSRVEAPNQAPAVVDAALRADAAALPVLTGVDLGNQGYAIVRINKVLPRDVASADNLKQARKQYSQWWTAAEAVGYYSLLKERFKAQIKVAKPVARSREELAASMTQ